MMNPSLLGFLREEAALLGQERARSLQTMICRLIDAVLENGMPMEDLKLGSFQEALSQSRNAEEALLAAHWACAETSLKLADIRWPNKNSFGAWLSHLRGEPGRYEKPLVLGCLGRLNLEEAYLWGADLRGAYLWAVNLRRADLRAANLLAAQLVEADLTEADLSGADLTAVDLSDAELMAADLSNADLSAANLEGANLTAAQLVGTDLWEAELERVNLRGANLTLADLRGTFNLNLEGATWDPKNPPKVDPPITLPSIRETKSSDED